MKQHRTQVVCRWFAAVLALAATLLVLAAPTASATTTDPDIQTVYSGDGMWRARVHAWTTNLVAYKSIGTTVYSQHKEWACSGLFCINGHRWQWVDRRATAISIRNGYEPFPRSRDCTPSDPSACIPPAPPRSCRKELTNTFDCFDWGVMFAYSSDSGVRPGTAQLNAKTVQSSGTVYLPDGQQIQLGPVQNSFWF